MVELTLYIRLPIKDGRDGPILLGEGDFDPPMSKALLLIVRRGAFTRFHALKEKAADLKVVLAWDRRKGERRRGSGAGAVDRRLGDRRKQPPFTWDTADFLVAGETTVPDEHQAG